MIALRNFNPDARLLSNLHSRFKFSQELTKLSFISLLNFPHSGSSIAFSYHVPSIFRARTVLSPVTMLFLALLSVKSAESALTPGDGHARMVFIRDTLVVLEKDHG